MHIDASEMPGTVVLGNEHAARRDNCYTILACRSVSCLHWTAIDNAELDLIILASTQYSTHPALITPGSEAPSGPVLSCTDLRRFSWVRSRDMTPPTRVYGCEELI